MKKIIGIALALAVIATLSFSSLAFADPTDVTVNWDDGAGEYASGVVGTTFTAGDDSVASFETAGVGIRGSFSATDTNSGMYGIDGTSSQIVAEVQGGGYIWNQYEQTDCYSGYGPAGQWAYATVSVNGPDSYGTLALKHYSNYAKLGSYNFGFYTPVPYRNQFAALNTVPVGENPGYYMERSVYGGTSPNDDSASVWAVGSGDATLGCAYAYNNPLKLGWSSSGNAYSYTAEFLATGTGQFNVQGVGDRSVEFHRYFNGLNDLDDQAGVTLTQVGSFSSLVPSGDSLTFVGPTSLRIIADYTSSLDVANYGTTVR